MVFLTLPSPERRRQRRRVTDLQLEAKVAVVTGASKGIGLAVVRTLAAEGMRVVGGALTADELVRIERDTALAGGLDAERHRREARRAVRFRLLPVRPSSRLR
jgi:NAD(P)-dependent dehydrogenase (short-subunit alcohol dehydrogenase family)